MTKEDYSKLIDEWKCKILGHSIVPLLEDGGVGIHGFCLRKTKHQYDTVPLKNLRIWKKMKYPYYAKTKRTSA